MNLMKLKRLTNIYNSSSFNIYYKDHQPFIIDIKADNEEFHIIFNG